MDYKWINQNDGSLTKYQNNGDILEIEDDAARTNMGGAWMTPTLEQFNELQELELINSTKNGVVGCELIGKNGNKLFFPETYFMNYGKAEKLDGASWSLLNYKYEKDFVASFFCISNSFSLQFVPIVYGFPVRGVLSKKKTNKQ